MSLAHHDFFGVPNFRVHQIEISLNTLAFGNELRFRIGYEPNNVYFFLIKFDFGAELVHTNYMSCFDFVTLLSLLHGVSLKE